MNKPKICILTQTANQLSEYYLKIFEGFDIFFITFKQPHFDAIDFMPGSTWSEGRNRLWHHVNNNYDYYLFIDDDLNFFSLRFNISPYIIAMLEKLRHRKVFDSIYDFCYQQIDSSLLMCLLTDVVKKYNPAILSLKNLSNHRVDFLDQVALSKGKKLRMTGWFDAQVTLFSNLAANILLPYDTTFSGWWSAQIPIYFLGSLMFQEESIYVLDIAAKNLNINGKYREDYDGIEDCKAMSKWMAKHSKNLNYLDLFCEIENEINHSFNAKNIIKLLNFPKSQKSGNICLSRQEYLYRLKSILESEHPYILSRNSIER